MKKISRFLIMALFAVALVLLTAVNMPTAQATSVVGSIVVSPTYTSDTSFTYDGQAHSVPEDTGFNITINQANISANPLSAGRNEFEFSSNNFVVEIELLKHTDAGTDLPAYAVTVTENGVPVSEDKIRLLNCNKITINKKSVNISAKQHAAKTYDGNQASLEELVTIEGLVGGDTIDCTINYNDGANGVDVGLHYFTVSAASNNSNYTVNTLVPSGSVNITQLEIIVEPQYTDSSWYYSGYNMPITFVVKAGGEKVGDYYPYRNVELPGGVKGYVEPIDMDGNVFDITNATDGYVKYKGRFVAYEDDVRLGNYTFTSTSTVGNLWIKKLPISVSPISDYVSNFTGYAQYPGFHVYQNNRLISTVQAYEEFDLPGGVKACVKPVDENGNELECTYVTADGRTQFYGELVIQGTDAQKNSYEVSNGDLANYQIIAANVEIKAKDQAVSYGQSIKTDVSDETVEVSGLDGVSLDALHSMLQFRLAVSNDNTAIKLIGGPEGADLNGDGENDIRVTYEEGALTLDPIQLFVIPDSINETYCGNPYTVTYGVYYAADCLGKAASGESVLLSHGGSLTYTTDLTAEQLTNAGGPIAITGNTVLTGVPDGAYEIITVDRKELTISKRPLTVRISGNAAIKVFDGQEHSAGYTIEVDGENTYEYDLESVTCSGDYVLKATNAGTLTKEINAADFQNTDENFDVSFEVNSLLDEVVLTINKRKIEFGFDSANYEKTYDGITYNPKIVIKDLSSNVELARVEKLEEFTLPFGTTKLTFNYSDNMFTNAGEFTFKVHLVSSDGIDKDNYEFSYGSCTLKINPYPVTIRHNSAEFIYGENVFHPSLELKLGDRLVNIEGDTAISGARHSLPSAPGTTVDIITKSAYTGDGRSAVSNEVLAVDYNFVIGGNGSPDNYAVTTIDGTLNIKPRPYTIKSVDIIGTYDGVSMPFGFVVVDETTQTEKQIRENAIFAPENLPVGEKFSMEALLTSDERTNVCHDKEIHFIVNDESGVGFDNLSITHEFGRLTIEPRKIAVESNSVERTYDGTLYNPTYKIVDLSNGGKVLYEAVTAGVYDVPGGKVIIENAVSDEMLTHVNKVDDVVTPVQLQFAVVENSNYAYTTAYGNLTIKPRPIFVLSEGMEKVYDGQMYEPVYHVYDMTTAAGPDDIETAIEIEPIAVDHDNATGKAYRYKLNVFGDELLVINNRSASDLTNANILDAEDEGVQLHFESAKYPASVSSDYDFDYAVGRLKITPAPVTVNVVGNKMLDYVYDGTEQSVGGFATSANHELYELTDIRFSGAALVAGTNAGEYPMGLKADQFANTDPNFTVTFNVTDGRMVIKPRPVNVSVSGSKTFGVTDPLTLISHMAAENVIPADIAYTPIYELFDFDLANAVREQGEAAGEYTLNVTEENGVVGNYDVTFVEGKFTIGLNESQWDVKVSEANTHSESIGFEIVAKDGCTLIPDFHKYVKMAVSVSGLPENVKLSEGGEYVISEGTTGTISIPLYDYTVKDANGNEYGWQSYLPKDAVVVLGVTPLDREGYETEIYTGNSGPVRPVETVMTPSFNAGAGMKVYSENDGVYQLLDENGTIGLPRPEYVSDGDWIVVTVNGNSYVTTYGDFAALGLDELKAMAGEAEGWHGTDPLRSLNLEFTLLDTTNHIVTWSMHSVAFDTGAANSTQEIGNRPTEETLVFTLKDSSGDYGTTADKFGGSTPELATEGKMAWTNVQDYINYPTNLPHSGDTIVVTYSDKVGHSVTHTITVVRSDAVTGNTIYVKPMTGETVPSGDLTFYGETNAYEELVLTVGGRSFTVKPVPSGESYGVKTAQWTYTVDLGEIDFPVGVPTEIGIAYEDLNGKGSVIELTYKDEAQTPAPDDEAQTPAPDDEAQTPAPGGEAQTPAPGGEALVGTSVVWGFVEPSARVRIEIEHADGTKSAVPAANIAVDQFGYYCARLEEALKEGDTVTIRTTDFCGNTKKISCRAVEELKENAFAELLGANISGVYDNGTTEVADHRFATPIDLAALAASEEKTLEVPILAYKGIEIGTVQIVLTEEGRLEVRYAISAPEYVPAEAQIRMSSYAQKPGIEELALGTHKTVVNAIGESYEGVLGTIDVASYYDKNGEISGVLWLYAEFDIEMDEASYVEHGSAANHYRWLAEGLQSESVLNAKYAESAAYEKNMLYYELYTRFETISGKL